jgi:hypothetical protein
LEFAFATGGCPARSALNAGSFIDPEQKRRTNMNRRDLLTMLTSASVGVGILVAPGAVALAQAGKAAADMYAHCTKACADCHAACSACATHCAGMIKSGDKTHVKSKQLAEDCGDICATAAKLTARKGPMTAAICDACAKACDACGAECAKYPDMKPMQDCVKSCKVCAKACRDMIASHKA